MKLFPLLLSVVVTLAGAAGCAGQDAEVGKPVDRLAEARAALPEEIKQAGVLVGGTDPTFEPMTFMTGSTFTGPYGIGVAKDRTTLTGAFQAALYSLINDGSYDQLLAKWKVKEGALRTGAINGGA